MTGFKKYLGALGLVFVLASCGGGGGDSPGLPAPPGGNGTNGSGTSGTDGQQAVSAPTIVLSLVDASDAPIASHSINGGAAYVKAVLLTGQGAAVPNKLVSFSTDPAVAVLLTPTVLSDASGIARAKISPASLTSAGAGTVTVAAAIDGNAPVTATLDYQTSAANVVLGNLVAGATSITALQTSAVSVQARVNGVPVASGQVKVSFSASCGTFSPVTAATASSGLASAVYQSAATCSGPVTLTAQVAGASPVSTTINVLPAAVANLLFDSVDRQTIFTSRAASGEKQATLKFKVVDANGAPMALQGVLLDLSTAASAAGVRFADGTTNTQAVSTDANGLVAVTVASGAMPTPVAVTAKLATNFALYASSLPLTVASGVPTQNAASLSAEKLSLEAWAFDGVTTRVTFRIADRQGNAIPEGTAVNLVASHGQIGMPCNLDVNSACTVTYTSQGVRPANGRAIVLAYLDGEESFVDANGNNIYDLGETFADMGMVYRDDSEDGVRQLGEQTYPGGMTGALACVPLDIGTPSVAGTCDGVWSESIRVRNQLTIALATSNARITEVENSRTATDLKVTIADQNGNSMPTGSTLSASVTTSGSACAIVGMSPNKTPNTSAASQHTIFLNGDASCTTAAIAVKVTTPAGFETIRSF